MSPEINKNLRASLEAEALFASIGEGVVTTDELGNISRINDIGAQIFGLKREEIIGKWYPGTIIAEDYEGNVIPPLDRPITEAFLSGKAVFSRLKYRRPDGSRVAVALTVSPIMIKGKPVGAIQVFRDISQEVELENMKDEFISIASHQLRTPATVVKQYLGILLEGHAGKLDDHHRNIVQTAYDSNELQLHIINDLLRVAQADSNTVTLIRKNIDLRQLAETICREQKDAFDQDQLQLRMSSKIKSVYCSVDPLHIRMVIENILDNARKYSKTGGIVTVTVGGTQTQAVISVEDQGIGIKEEDLPKLFAKFSRLSNETFVSGTGLGLYWVKKLVDLHDGTINVSSEVNVGTKFIIRIPLEK